MLTTQTVLKACDTQPRMALLSDAESVAIWKGTQGEVEIFRFGSVAAYLRMKGLAEQPAAPLIKRTLETLFAASISLHTFWDLRDLTNYHSDVRVYSTSAALAHKKKLASLHTLSTSKIVAMGVSVANLALGGIIINHKSAESFERALRDVLRAQQSASL
jgi:hypothetical protein